MATPFFRATSEQPECRSFPSPRLTREQVVDRIITINPTATADFLNRFRDQSLELYLERLSTTMRRGASWVRQEETPAIMGAARRE